MNMLDIRFSNKNSEKRFHNSSQFTNSLYSSKVSWSISRNHTALFLIQLTKEETLVYTPYIFISFQK